jgi:hypothetical protein
MNIFIETDGQGNWMVHINNGDVVVTFGEQDEAMKFVNDLVKERTN